MILKFFKILYIIKVWINGEQVDVRESEDQIKEVDVGTQKDPTEEIKVEIKVEVKVEIKKEAVNGVGEDLDEGEEGAEGDERRVEEVKVKYVRGHLPLQEVVGRMTMYLLMMIWWQKHINNVKEVLGKIV